MRLAMAREKNGFLGDVIQAASGSRMSFSGSSVSQSPSRYFGVTAFLVLGWTTVPSSA